MRCPMHSCLYLDDQSSGPFAMYAASRFKESLRPSKIKHGPTIVP